jgi:hypothetical protein
MARTRSLCSFVLLGLAAAAGSAAQNLLGNPDFPVDLSGWTVVNPGDGVWSASDRQGVSLYG